ncbi:serine aminopeptidase domain-containing protein [Rhizobium sp. SL42]|uniref:serine aminopeptidase domain-containing protein n=1 Tax=Rhizobium sp. SL42 TaxID=2806346 RepID=UPI001F384847|nr:alpha/beta hydrolase [Rhizobium sp. SL42]
MSAAQPTVFGSHVGLFSAPDEGLARRDLAVLFLSPWGMEEMCTRKFYRILAERFASLGVASLRFDYPGAANAFGAPEGSADPSGSGLADSGLACWLSTIGEAIAELKALSGTRHIVLLGQGLGGSLGFLRAPMETDIAGLMLLGPVLKGRNYLRELSLWSKMIDEPMQIRTELRDTSPGAIAGLRMPAAVASDLKTLDLSAAPPLDPALPLFLGQRPGNHGDIAFGEILRKTGGNPATANFTGYDQLVSGPLSQTMPGAFIETMLSFVQALPQFHNLKGQPARLPVIRPIVCGDSRETPVRFGDGDCFYGTLCQPVASSIGVTAVILSTSYDHQAGWAGSSAEMARRLAAIGVSSLRYDAAGVGDSPPIPGRRRQVLYDDAQLVDVAAAYDFLQTLGLADRTLIVGRCSGAYIALRAAISDPRWNGLVAVNPDSLLWRFKGLPRTLTAYSQTILKRETIRRVLAGEVDTLAALRNIAVRLIDRAARSASRFVKAAVPITRLSSRVHSEFLQLQARGTRVVLVYAEGDEGLERFHVHFGPRAEKLDAYGNVEFHMIADADHNLTPLPARERLFAIVESTARQLAARHVI